MQDFFSPIKPARNKIAHYYGDTVRQLFLAGGIMILVVMPFYNNIVPMNPTIVTLFVVTIALAAAATTNTKKSIIVFDTVLSAVTLIMFETYSIVYYLNDGMFLLLIRQGIALIFLFALYYSAKTLRAMCWTPTDIKP